MDRESLHHKLSKLQLQLQVQDFNNRISPVKKQVEKSSKSQDKAKCDCSMVKSIKLVFFLCPFIFPAYVYSLEGCCASFWQATAVSTSILALMVFLSLSYRVKDIMDNLLGGVQSNVKIVVQDTDYLGSKRKCQFAVLLMLLLITSTFSYWTVLNNMPTLFNMCLVASGFIGGILSVNIYEFWKEPKKLPYLSPMARKGEDKKNRKLNFCDTGIKRLPSLSPTHNYTTSKEGPVHMEFQGLVPLEASNKEAVPKIQYQSRGTFNLF